jgi:hypothetical protein
MQSWAGYRPLADAALDHATSGGCIDLCLEGTGVIRIGHIDRCEKLPAVKRIMSFDGAFKNRTLPRVLGDELGMLPISSGEVGQVSQHFAHKIAQDACLERQFGSYHFFSASKTR